MPTYEYQCTKCGHEFEIIQSIAAPPLTICPKEKCPRKKWGRGKVKKLLSTGGGLIFKGSGFYITDYRSDKYKEAAKKESTPAKPSGGESKTSGTKTESKPGKSEKS